MTYEATIGNSTDKILHDFFLRFTYKHDQFILQ